MSRICLEDAVRHTCKRNVYGKPLIEQPVVRYKLSHMARMIESQQAWIESLVYQSNILSHNEVSPRER
jgi:alkylation response protein AidB-like acyl-CoA dehydrogenase